MKIEINHRAWEIKRVSPNNVNLKYEDVKLCGITQFIESTIYINKDLNPDLMKDTICHELAHAFIFVYGHPQYDKFDEENVCDMFGTFGIELTDLAKEIFKKWELN